MDKHSVEDYISILTVEVVKLCTKCDLEAILESMTSHLFALLYVQLLKQKGTKVNQFFSRMECST